MPIKIFHFITELSTGGAQMALVRLLTHLDRNRFEPFVVCLYNGDGEPAQQIKALGISVIDLKMANKLRLDALWRLYKIVHQLQPAILHSWMFHANILGRIIGRLNHVPIVIISRRTINLDGIGREWINRQLAPLSNKIIAVSEQVRQKEIEQACVSPAKVITIRNGIDAQRYQQIDPTLRTQLRQEFGIPSEAIVIGAVGRFHPVKGFDNLLTAMKLVHAQFSEVYLLLVGDGELRVALEAQSQSLGLAEVVVFTGLRSDISQILTAIDIFALPSQVEGMPNVVLEAMAAGLPVVATNVGGVSEIIINQQTGLLIPPNNQYALAEALSAYIQNPLLRQKMGQAGYQQIKTDFDIAQTVQKTVSVYDELLEENRVKMTANVLQVITRLIVGGAQETAMLIADMLDSDIYSVHLLTGPQTGSEGSLIEETRRRQIALSLENSLVREINPIKDFKALIKLYRFIKQGQYTIVHTHSSKAGILGRWAAKAAGVPIIVHTVHGWGHTERQHPLVRQFYIRLEKLTLPITDKLIVVSPRDIEKGLRDGIGRPDDYVVIRSGIELDRFGHPQHPRDEMRAALNIPPDAPVVGTVTRLSPQKAPLDFIRAAAMIARAAPDVWFVMVGDGPLRLQVEALSRQLGLTGRLILAGLRRDVPELINTFDIFALSSLWEGLPRVLPQAMATGLPIVATAIDGNAEAVEDGVNGLLVPPGDPEALAGAVLELLKNPRFAATLGEAGRHRVKEFGALRMVKQIEQLYRRLLTDKGIA